jgi:hypothetical protein
MKERADYAAVLLRQQYLLSLLVDWSIAGGAAEVIVRHLVSEAADHAGCCKPGFAPSLARRRGDSLL